MIARPVLFRLPALAVGGRRVSTLVTLSRVDQPVTIPAPPAAQVEIE